LVFKNVADGLPEKVVRFAKNSDADKIVPGFRSSDFSWLAGKGKYFIYVESH
jgi:hypothetical protein